MAKKSFTGVPQRIENPAKGTSIGRGLVKTSSMNKSKRRSYKKYRGQGQLEMAKYTRHDSRNKKRNKHKNQTKFGGGYKMKGEDYNRSHFKNFDTET